MQAGAGRRTISLRCEEPGLGLRGLGLSQAERGPALSKNTTEARDKLKTQLQQPDQETMP